MSEDAKLTTGAVADAAAPVTEAPKPTPAEDAIARRERQIRNIQKQSSEKVRQLEAKLAQYETDYVPKSALANDTLGTLMSNGVTLEKLSELILSAPNQNDPMVKQMRAIEAKLQAQEQAMQTQQTQQYEQAKNQINNEAKMLIDSDPEFETVKAEGMSEAVTDLIVETFEKTGKLMDVREAALEVENYLVDQAVKLAKYGKVQKRLLPEEPKQPQQAPVAKQPQVTATLKTLTNNMQTQPAKRSSDKERIARAMAAFKGELK